MEFMTAKAGDRQAIDSHQLARHEQFANGHDAGGPGKWHRATMTAEALIRHMINLLLAKLGWAFRAV
jgi:hypothetical protein